MVQIICVSVRQPGGGDMVMLYLAGHEELEVESRNGFDGLAALGRNCLSLLQGSCLQRNVRRSGRSGREQPATMMGAVSLISSLAAVQQIHSIIRRK